jgi:methionyl-tRNA formyltransferase
VVLALQSLLDNSYEICGVFTQPDRPSGRGQKLQPSPVKALAQKQGIPIFQPEKIRTEENQAIVEELRPDFIVAAAYGQIIPAGMVLFWLPATSTPLPPPRSGPIPGHLNGDAVSGVTTMAEAALTQGCQEEVAIPLAMTMERWPIVGSGAASIRTLAGLQKSELKPIPQAETQVTWRHE